MEVLIIMVVPFFGKWTHIKCVGRIGVKSHFSGHVIRAFVNHVKISRAFYSLKQSPSKRCRMMIIHDYVGSVCVCFYNPNVVFHQTIQVISRRTVLLITDVIPSCTNVLSQTQ